MKEKTAGAVRNVIYYNEKNSYAIFSIRSNDLAGSSNKVFTDTLTVLCYMDRMPVDGEQFIFTGEYITNQYGLQFKADKFERVNMRTLNGVVSFLSSGLFPGVGKKTATRIFEGLGPDCLNKIEGNCDVLSAVRGITEKQKTVIHGKLVKEKNNREAVIGLLNLGFTMRTALKIIRELGPEVNSIIRENPYILMEQVEGFGFKRADKIAIDMGFSPDSEKRLQALLLYIINSKSFFGGDVYFDYKELYLEVTKTIGKGQLSFSVDTYQDILKTLIAKGKIYVEEQYIYDINLYQAEVMVAQKVRFFVNRNIKNDNDSKITTVLNKITAGENFEYTEKQKEAIITSLLKYFTIITGGPGTGKSTIIKAIVECTKLMYPGKEIKQHIALLAPTGRAAKRLRELTGHPATTIHKFLGYEGNGVYRFGPEAPVAAKLIIVDEFSMVDIILAARLFSSFPDDARIILVGDVDQLPSVSQGDVLNDLINSERIVTIRLDKIHRQSVSSNIVNLAHDVNKGVIPADVLKKYDDRSFIKARDREIIKAINIVVKRALSLGMDLVRDIQVLVPMYDGYAGINAVNAVMQQEFNPLSGKELKHQHRGFRVNDKVLQLANRSDKNVMNGDIGFVSRVNAGKGRDGSLMVMFDIGEVEYSYEELGDLTHAYAISIHKAQGSEYDVIIVPFSAAYKIMLRRKLIYTALTRAKKYLIMIGDERALFYGVSRIENKRKTRLSERIKNEAGDILCLKNTGLNEMVNLTPYDFLK